MSQRRGKKKELIMEPTATQTYKQTKEVHSKPSYIKKKNNNNDLHNYSSTGYLGGYWQTN